MTKTTLKHANPNAHGRVALICYTDTDFETEAEHESTYTVCTIGDDRDSDGTDFDTLAEAEAFYEAQVAYWAQQPNWDAQAAYDERWGTDNGYGRHQVGEF
jgi:hypothetical protein